MTIEQTIDPPKNAGEYTEEIFDEICERMANGKGLREICQDPEMPNRSTFLRWVANDSGRERKYQAAREACMDWYAEEILTIAWDSSNDTITDAKGRQRCNNEWVNRSRLKVDTLKFLMAKLHPKKYGDRVPETITQRSHEEALLELEAEKPKLVVRWQREIVEPIRDDAGNIVNLNDPSALRGRIKELEAQLAEARGEASDQPPKLLTFDPGPLPSRMDGEVVTRVVDFIKQKMPGADQQDPQAVLDELMSRISEAWDAKYGAKSDAA
jgi:hypothetical protein